MSDIVNRLKDYLFDNKISNIPEIKYLQESDLILTINRGFTELFRRKPKNPIIYLSKWLSRESLSKELEQQYKENKIRRENLKHKYYLKERQNYIMSQRNNEVKKVRKEYEDSLITEINSCKDFWLGFNHICERLKTLTNSTGCYICIYDQKRRPVTDEDDMDGHLDPSGVKVLRYIGWNNDHDFLDGKYLEQNEGVTYDLINNKSQINVQENQQEKVEEKKIEEKKENNEINIDSNIKTLMIEDVVNDNRIKFFREPRLGCYLVLDLTYKTSLSYNSLLSAIQCTKNYETAKEEQEARKKEWSEKQEEIKNQIKELKETKIKEEEARKLAEENEIKAKLAGALSPEGEVANPPQTGNANGNSNGNGQTTNSPMAGYIRRENIQELDENIENLEKQLTEWHEEPVKLQEYDKGEKNIYLCLDTLGQDRVFNNEEINYIKKIGINIRQSIEKLEQNLLEKDRDIRIHFLDEEKRLKALDKYSDEKFEECSNMHIAQYYASEEYKAKNITDERTRTFDGELERLRYYKNLFLKDDCLELLLTFQEFEFVEQLKVFQSLFFFAKKKPSDINQIKTNKLEWKKARIFWKDLFTYIIKYNPLGPKPQEVEKIYKLNKIKDNLETCLQKREEIKSYSELLVMFIDFVLYLIKVRHDDIINRLCKTALYKDRREKIIERNANIDEERQKIINRAKVLNPRVKVPGETVTEEKEEEHKEEEKKEEENTENKNLNEEKKSKDETKEKKKDEEKNKTEHENNAESKEKESEENELKNKDELDSAKLAEDLQKFDEENPKQEVPPDIEYDIDNDYDIDQNEKDTEINNALLLANNAILEKDKNRVNSMQSIANNNGQANNPQVNEIPQGK